MDIIQKVKQQKVSSSNKIQFKNKFLNWVTCKYLSVYQVLQN